MKKILLLSFLFAATMLSAQKPVELPLWPNGAPNNNELTNSGQNHNNEWVSDVTTPTLTVYPASHPNGMAIIRMAQSARAVSLRMICFMLYPPLQVNQGLTPMNRCV